MKKTLVALATSLALSLSLSSVAFATEQTVLRLSTWASPSHPINAEVLTQWSENVTKATDGRVVVEMLYDLAPPPAQMETVADQVADIAWVFHGLSPGRFVLTKIAEFPLAINQTAEQISVAYWRTHKEYLESANEHQGLKVLGLGVHAPGHLLTAEPISEFADVGQSRIRVGGGVMADVAEKLGINRVAISTPEVYQALSQGVVSGTFLTIETLKSMKLVEVSPYVYYVPGGTHGGTFSIFMNGTVWDNLSEQDQVAIESVSYEHLSKLFGTVLDNADVVGLEYALENGAVLTQATDDDVAKIAAISIQLKEGWITQANERGIDGEAALNFFNEQLKSLEQ